MTKNDLLGELEIACTRWKGPVLSAYLNVDPKNQINWNRDYVPRCKNLARMVEKSCPAEERQALRAAYDRLEQELTTGDAPRGKALIILCDAAGGELWRRDVRKPLRETLEWGSKPYLLPLLEALDEYERFAVALVDRSRARLFLIGLGEIEEVADFVSDRVSPPKSPGSDHPWSEGNFRRRAEEHARRHAMDVVEALIDSERRLGWDRLILAGPLEGRKEVERLLPKRLQSKVVGSVALWVEAKRDDILEVAEEIEAAIERKGEQQMVENLVQDAAKNHAAVLGLEPTLATLREGRIDKLLVAGDFRPKWSDLPDMALWLDEGQTRQEGSLLERILERTLADGGRVEFVWGEASDLLRERGDGIGAFLRY